ncbi:flagellar L-ring protein precursor [Pseudooceanicola batsensis HTCC2597]|uniref:Flagellar L-ring protein n=1 Tax=Pseudooceanicola batsensis (strain ATCC BAA-863 / DSM 15984 / KCTC 12145 / HTCC2597) TaxID=252305 RepID=A3U107_PSEBH|nr:flagellar basal body L-ring protein FlgH [Pseudooceanicola batsensis]EAQ01990.1 flagellar L-ring protein precursor [Pseudooceanicola batsensis HTCC2597]
MKSPRTAQALRLTISTLAVVAVAGCASDPFDRDPRISGVEMSPHVMPEVARVQVPMPPPEVPRTPERGEQSSLWQRGSGGFFADQRATKVGDILTITIEIDDQAQLSNSTDRERSGNSEFTKPQFFGYASKLHKILPGVGAGQVPDPLVQSSSSTTASGSGSIARNETISLKVAALVVQMLPNGNMVVAGRQEVKVNEELRELRVAGIIRPEDIATNNTIPYEKIAEARITYGGEGSLSRQQSRSYGEDIVDIVLPY